GLATQALQSPRWRGREKLTSLLGYPLCLCQALDTANSLLATVDDRRKLAITFFSEVTPRAQATRLTPQQHVRAALVWAQWVHPLVCTPDCPRTAVVVQRLNGYLATGELMEEKSVPECPTLLKFPGELISAATAAIAEAEAAAGAAWTKSWPGRHSAPAAVHA